MHPTPDVLALLALGETAGTDEDREHLRECATCREEVDEFARVVEVARELQREELQRPADRVWPRIRSELGLRADPDHPPASGPQLSVPAGFGSASVLGRATLFAQPHWSGVQGTAVVEADTDQQRTVRIRLQGSPSESPPDGRVAVWLIAPDLSDMVHLGSMRSGPQALAGQDATLTIPGDVDLLRFPVVDLSRQPADDLDAAGALTHSGDSIVRGVLS